MTRPSHFCAYIQRKQKEDLKEGPALPSLQHFFFFFFTKVKTRKQAKCLPVDEWTKKIWCIYARNRTPASDKNISVG